MVLGLLSVRTPVQSETLIPVELTMLPQAEQVVELVGEGRPEATPKATLTPVVVREPVKRAPSSAGGPRKAAPAPPKVLTAKSGQEPAGPVGEGREKAGPGGQEDIPAGPSYGPGILRGPLPTYPKNALDQDLEGTVKLSVLVGEDASVKSVSVASSSGHALLDQAAIRMIKQAWRFSPGMSNGKPAPGKVIVTFKFSASEVRKR